MNQIFVRRQRRFLGIRSHPDFVEAITIAFETSAASLEGLLRSGEGKLDIKSDLFALQHYQQEYVQSSVTLRRSPTTAPPAPSSRKGAT